MNVVLGVFEGDDPASLRCALSSRGCLNLLSEDHRCVQDSVRRPAAVPVSQQNGADAAAHDRIVGKTGPMRAAMNRRPFLQRADIDPLVDFRECLEAELFHGSGQLARQLGVCAPRSDPVSELISATLPGVKALGFQVCERRLVAHA